jgi:hypothetical protein
VMDAMRFASGVQAVEGFAPSAVALTKIGDIVPRSFP